MTVRVAATALMQRAEQAGDRAVVATVDAPVQGVRTILRAEPENTLMLAGSVTIGGNFAGLLPNSRKRHHPC